MLFLYLDFVNNIAVNMGVQISRKTLFAYSLDIYPEMELLNHIIVLFLVSGGISLVAVPVNIPTNSV